MPPVPPKQFKPLLASEDEIACLNTRDRELISVDLFAVSNDDLGASKTQASSTPAVSNEAGQVLTDYTTGQIEMARSSLDLELYNLPIDRTSAHVEACLRCPGVVARESNPDAFLVAADLSAEVSISQRMTTFTRRKKFNVGWSICLGSKSDSDRR